MHYVLRQPEDKYRAMLETMEQGFCVMELVRDDSGRIRDLIFRDVSASFERQTGLRGVIGRRVSDVWPHFGQQWIDVYTRVSRTGEAVTSDNYVPDVDRWYRVHQTRFGGRDSPFVTATFDDITASKRAENALRESEENYRRVFDSIDEGFCIFELIDDGHGTVVDYRLLQVNQAFARQTGIADATGKLGSEIAVNTERYWFDTYDAVARTGEPRRMEFFHHATGRWYNAYASRIGAAGSRRICTVFSDVTERKFQQRRLEEMNQELERRVRERTTRIEALFARLTSAQEEERRRIARDIHDQLGQQITALRMNLEVLTSRAQRDDEVSRQLVRTQRLAEELDRMADSLTSDLRPASLDHLGLVAALKQLVSEWSERFGVAAEFQATVSGSPRLPPNVEINLYRIAQEALHNVAKHGEATNVDVCLQHGDGQLVLSIEDDGRGFTVNEEAADGREGFGLLNMRERATLIGGCVEIESKPNHGTTVFTRVRL